MLTMNHPGEGPYQIASWPKQHLLERLGDYEGAILHYRRAADRTASIAERTYLLMQAAQLSDRRGERPRE